MGQDNGVGAPMGQMELGAQGVGNSMNKSQSRGVEGQTRHAGGVMHLLTGQQILTVSIGLRQPTAHQGDCFFRHGIREIIEPGGYVGLHRVGQSI